MIKNLSVLFLVVVLTAVLGAQSGQTGNIKGTAKAPDGNLLPGVTVVLQSPSMVIERMETITNENGKYRFMGLNPGRYQLKFILDGMATVVRKGIVINANVTITIDQKMELKNIEENIVVKGKAPTIDRQSTANTSSMDSHLLDAIPAGRDMGTYFNMTPGVNGSSAQGSTVRDNSYNLDGVQMNDPVVGTRGASFSVEIMEEISVQTGGLSAEYGSAKGAVVNVITKSGGNRFSGTASVYYDHESFQSDNTEGTPLSERKVGSKYRFEPGLSLGGPVIKDKLWFFVNFSMANSESYTTGYPANSDTELPVEDKKIFPYLKLSYQPSMKDKFVISANYSKREINHDGASQWITESRSKVYKSPDYTLSGHWTHTFSANMFANFKVGYFHKEMNWLAKNKQPKIYHSDTWISEGGAGYDDENIRKRLQVNADATTFVENLFGSHEIKFGVQMTHGQGRRVVTTYGKDDGHGMRIYSEGYWGDDLIWIEASANHDRKTNVLNLGFFLNDTWNISSSLTLNLGFRFDYSRSYVPEHVGTAASDLPVGDFGFLGRPDEKWDMNIDKAYTLYDWKNITPRIGLVYDVFQDGTTLVKASYSRYLQDNYSSIAFDAHPVNWTYYCIDTYPDGSLYAVWSTSAPGASCKIGYNGAKLKAPHTDEFNIAIERELWEDWSVSVRGVRKKDRDLIETVDANALDIDTLMDSGEMVWKNFSAVDVTDPMTGNTVVMWEKLQSLPSDLYLVNPKGAKRDYRALELSVKKRYSKNWSCNISYVLSKSWGLIGTAYWDAESRTSLFTNPNPHVNGYGRLGSDRTHQLKVNALVKGPWGINLSGYFTMLSGARYTRTLSSKNLGLKIYGDPVVKAEAMGSHRLPMYTRLDLRLEKSFRFSETFKVRIFTDIFNVLNSQATTDVINATKQYNKTFGQVIGIQDPRIFRLGAKIEF